MADTIVASPGVIGRALSAQPSSGFVHQVVQQQQQFLNVMGTINPEQAQIWQAQIQEEMYGENARKAEALTNKLRVSLRSDSIRHLQTVGEIQTAPDSMIRGIMANPTVRQLYHDGILNGYGERYVDVHPNAVGVNHRDYRDYTSGVVMDHGDGVMQAKIFNDQFGMDEIKPTFFDKTNMMMTWAACEEELSQEINVRDVTDEDNPTIY